MTGTRRGRRRYYDIFSRFYDAFVRIHSRRDEDGTRTFLTDAAGLEGRGTPRVLDVCCGTGSVILEFRRRFPGCLAIGLDFSHGMLKKAREKSGSGAVRFVLGDATALPFPDDTFDAVTCSHALYELKGKSRREALREMKRVVRPGGRILLMEHEVPRNTVAAGRVPCPSGGSFRESP